MRRATLAAAIAAVAVTVTPAIGAAAPNPDKVSAKLRAAVGAPQLQRHLRELQAIGERNGGTRASGTPGFDRSAQYVAGRLRAAGYSVTTQKFDFPYFQELAPSTLARVSPDPHTYGENEFSTMDYSGSGDVTGAVQAVDLVLPPGPTPSSSTSGCEDSDFAGFTAGNVALLQRGTCTFGEKVENAKEAGASAALIFNEGQDGRTEVLAGTLGGPASLPALGLSFAAGNELAGLVAAGETVVHLTTSTVSETRQTANVLADSGTGNADRKVIVGSHLDSVNEGPGINDNGSGSAQDLAIAEAYAKAVKKPANRVVFAFWGAEESGLLGSTHYVDGLTQAQRDRIMANLNFDMVGSPNFVRFVYDGDGSDNPDTGPGPVGSDVIEHTFVDFWGRRGLQSAPTAFDGRSDYGPFIAVGIPAGGTFSGAEGVKTPEQAAIFGGTAGLPYDACYHKACDTLANVNDTALDQFSDAAAHAVATLATRTAPLTDASAAKRKHVKAREFKGPNARK
jgi:Zn-dependent M28 family amino/carboxypeptidase